MSASAKPCVHGFWRTWMARVGDPVMMRTAVSLFIRKFTPGDATSRRDVPFTVGVRGVYAHPTRYEPCKNRTEYLGGSLLTQEVISFYFYTVRPTDTLDSR